MLQKLANSAEAQFKFNKFFLVFWAWQIPAIPVLVFSFPHFWLEIGVIYVAEASVWGVVATHLSGMSAALAAMSSDKTEDKIEDVADDVSELRDTVFQTPGMVIGPEVD